MDNYYLGKEGEKWKLKKEGSDRAVKTFETKDEGRDYSTGYVKEKGGSLKIKKTDGTFQEERTYPRADDPRKSKG